MVARFGCLVAILLASTLVSATNSGLVRAEEKNAFDKNQVLKGHTDHVTCVAFNENGCLATGSADKTAKVWDLKTGKEIFTLKHEHPVTALAFWGGKFLFTATTDESSRLPFPPVKVHIWNLTEKDKLVASLEGHADIITSMAIGFDGKTLATGSCDSTIKLWDLVTLKERATLKGHEGKVLSIAYDRASDRQGNTLASVGDDATIRLWDSDKGVQLAVLKEPKRQRTTGFSCVAFSRDGKTLATGTVSFRNQPECEVKLWDVEKQRVSTTLAQGLDKINAVTFSEDGKYLAFATRDKKLIIWDLAAGRPLLDFETQATVKALAFDTTGKKLAVGGAHLNILDLEQLLGPNPPK